MRRHTLPPNAARGFLRTAALGLAALALGCDSGGGAGDVIPIVTPLEGQWVASDGEALQFDLFDGDNLGGDDFPTEFDVTATLLSANVDCADSTDEFGDLALEGRIENGSFVLFAAGSDPRVICLRGSFVNLRALATEPVGERPARLYLNSRVDVEMDRGLWIGSGEDLPRLLFFAPSGVNNDASEDVRGCDLAASGDAVDFTGLMNGFDTNDDTPPFVPTLRSSASGRVLMSDVTVIDRDTISLVDARGRRITLSRTPATVDLDELPPECTSADRFR